MHNKLRYGVSNRVGEDRSGRCSRKETFGKMKRSLSEIRKSQPTLLENLAEGNKHRPLKIEKPVPIDPRTVYLRAGDIYLSV